MIFSLAEVLLGAGMPSKPCAYCKQTRTLTKEHVLPANLLRRSQEYGIRMSVKSPKVLPTQEFVIRDVCKVCNNEVLSHLDGFIQTAFVDHFEKIVVDATPRRIDLDGRKLGRWLAKTAYNSARFSGRDVEPFGTLVPYILGAIPTPRTLSVFTNLILPFVFNDPQTGERVNRPARDLRCSFVPLNEGVNAVAKLVALHGFFFYVVVWPTDVNGLRGADRQALEAFHQMYSQLDLDGTEQVFCSSGSDVFNTLSPSLLRDADKLGRFFNQKSGSAPDA